MHRQGKREQGAGNGRPAGTPVPLQHRPRAGAPLLLCVLCASVVSLIGCVVVRPEPTGGTPMLPGDPRVRVARVAAGEPAPFAGVLVNEWTWERVLEALHRNNGRPEVGPPGLP